ncbi:MAG: hypothetical protein M3400_05000 [Actinomycetota bacterium]|nr:hypothetical protein [Actinomycetota bacterium]
MLGKLGKTIAVTAMAGGSILFSAGGASAAHCVSPDGTSPGFSYFGTDHVQESDHAEGVNPGHGALGSPGAENCRDMTDPSDRAPGRNG